MVTNGFGNRNLCSQWEGSACTESALTFFLLSFGLGGGFHFSFVPNMFPFNFSMGSQYVPQGRSQ
jgi:hypothetical protein